MVRPDQVSLGVLVSAVPRDAVDAAVAGFGVGAKRSDGKLPAHVTAYLTMAMCLFADEDYEEVATKVTGSLSRWGCWDAGWSVPTASGITQARKRLGPRVLAEVFEQVAGPVADRSTRGAWLRGWRLVAIDGFEVDVPDTKGNAEEFGYAGSGANRSAFPKARVVALAECGTHAFLAAEVGAYSVGEKTLANRLYPRLRRDELLTADRGLCATGRFITFPAQSGGIGGTFLGPMAYPDSKEGRGLEHANKTGGRVQTNGAVHRGDPRDMAKAGLLEPQSPVASRSRPPENRLKPAPPPCIRIEVARCSLREVGNVQ